MVGLGERERLADKAGLEPVSKVLNHVAKAVGVLAPLQPEGVRNAVVGAVLNRCTAWSSVSS
jgi:hypothetical protein